MSLDLQMLARMLNLLRSFPVLDNVFFCSSTKHHIVSTCRWRMLHLQCPGDQGSCDLLFILLIFVFPMLMFKVLV